MEPNLNRKQIAKKIRADLQDMFKNIRSKKTPLPPLSENKKIALDLISKQREMQMQFLYFWIALNASSIAFVINTTLNTKFENAIYLIIWAIVLWGLSIIFGSFCLMFLMFNNHSFIQILSEKLSDTELDQLKEDEKYVKMALKVIIRMTFLFMIAGMILFLIWYFKNLK